MQIKRFGYHGKNKGHVITSRIVCGRKINKRVNVKLKDGKWLAENGFDFTDKIMNYELQKELERLHVR